MKKNTTKTICFFNSNRAWGGGEKWHFTTAKEFLHRGFNTFLVTNLRSELAKKGIAEKLNVFSFYVHNLSFINPFKLLTLMALFRSQKVDAIVMNLPSDLKLAGVAAKLAGVQKIIYRRGMPHPLRNTWLNRFLFKNILSHVVVNSQEIGRSLAKGNEEWFPHEKMVLIYNGVDTVAPRPQGKSVYSRMGDEVIIGNAARLTEQKGQKYLIEMAEILKNEGLNFKVLIAGEGELKKELESLIAKNDLTEEVILLGHVDDMPGFMNSIDLFVFPSLFEGSANTLIEAVHFGKPSIAFDVSSNPEIIQHEVNGYLARPFYSEDLAKYVLELVGSPEKREAFKHNGEKIIQDKFDSKRNLDVLEKII
jgi:glycosyltransferase involved in cell wall biosynthesis